MAARYFGSANSYMGFYSLFGEIFNRKKFERTFVLKGGPGTGKSTFMKKVANMAKDRGALVEYYYCSSDIESLDGLIIELNGKKIAIIDGTAPHENDAVYVGAADEIVNLGDGIDYDWIRSYREKIITLSDQKSHAYKSAYSYLKVAGECDKYINKKKMQSLDFKTADKYISDLRSMIQSGADYTEKKFISSFSKSGYRSFDLEAEKKINIGGDRREALLLLSYINENIRHMGKECFPAPLNIQYADALRFNKKIAIQYDSGEENVDSAIYFDQSPNAIEDIRVMVNAYKDFINEAIRWFGIASDIHFRLEEIYQKCMNFNENEEKIIETSKKIFKLCDCEN